jgi:hypothetical protein
MSARSTTRASRLFIAHLLIVARCVELSKDDAGESYQRVLPLFVRQQIPESVERPRPDGVRARGGATTVAIRDMGHLLAPLDGEFESIPPAAAGRPARLWGDPRIPVKAKKWL